MQQITQFVLVCSLFLPQLICANNKGPSIKEALEIAVNQQFLSQKISKIYLTLCHDVRNPTLYKERRVAVEQFEEQLYQLSLFVPNQRVKEYIQSVRLAWKNYKGIADWTIKKESISELLNQSSALLKASKMLHSAYQEYEYEYEYTLKENNDLITINQYINQIQHQKILIQQVLTYYLANLKAREDLDYSIQLETTQKSFSRILVILENASTTSASIQVTLKLIKTQWESILRQFETEGNDIQTLYEILMNGRSIEENIQELVETYEVLSSNFSLSYILRQGVEQSLLVQQMTTAYVTGKHQAAKYAYQQNILDQTLDFENNISSMMLAAPTVDIKDAVHVVEVMWKNYKRLLTNFEIIDAITTFKVLEHGQVLLAACDQVNLRIKRYVITMPSYQTNPLKEENTLSSANDFITQIERLNNLKIHAQRALLYFMMKQLDWDVNQSVNRLNSSQKSFDVLVLALDKDFKKAIPQSLLTQIKFEWKALREILNEGAMDDFVKLAAIHQALQQKLEKLNDLCSYELNQRLAQNL